MTTFKQWCESLCISTGDYIDHEIVYNAGVAEGYERRAANLAAITAARDIALAALKRLDTMCREDARFMVTSDGRVHDEVERVIAELEQP